jgi:CDP-diacylglycerol--serine O-phosphatidyltransferase
MLRGIYILPSLFTSANLAVGFVSVIFSIKSELSTAAWCILICIGLDVMDGKIARWTNTTSYFGVELDSLSDLVSFGIAPAVLMYQLVLYGIGRAGIAIALFFVIAGAIRLAKFNIKAHEGKASGDFSGLPIPAAAGILASFVLSYELFEQGSTITVKTIPLIMKRMPFFYKSIPAIMVFVSFLMLSSIPYIGKSIRFNRPKSLQLFILIVTAILLMVTYPQNTIFAIFFLYLLSGIFLYLLRVWRLRRKLKLPLRLKKTENETS